MLTAKDEVEDRVKGLTIGADDYVIKPFSFEELLARIQARLRNQFPNLFSEVTYGPFKLDDRRKEFVFNGKTLELSPTEYELLKFLVMNNGIVLSKGMILDRVWGYDFQGEENIVEVYIRSLRDKLNDKDISLSGPLEDLVIVWIFNNEDNIEKTTFPPFLTRSVTNADVIYFSFYFACYWIGAILGHERLFVP